MRPLRIELEGIGSFRDRTVVDLEDVDLFVLAGPTGAGKCLPGDVPVFDARSGEQVALERFVQERRSTTLGLVGGRFRPVPVHAWHDLGERDTVVVTLHNGSRLHAASTHPVVTDAGCVQAGELEPGAWVAQPRELPAVGPPRMSIDEAFVLGCLLGDGTTTRQEHLGFTNVDGPVIQAFQDALHRIIPGVELRRGANSITYRFANRLRGDERKTYIREVIDRLESKGIDLRSILGSNYPRLRRSGVGLTYETLATIEEDYGLDLHEEKCRLWANRSLRGWLEEMGAFGHDALSKRLPTWVTLQPEASLWPLLAGLMATDGTVNRSGVEFYTSSERLARDVQLVCMRLGLSPRLATKRTPRAVAYRLRFDVSSVLRLAANARIPGPKGERLQELVTLHGTKGRRYLADRLPPSMSRDLPTTSPDGQHYRTRQQLATCGMSRELFAAWGGDPALWDNDLRWSQVISIEPAGRHRCFDLSVDTEDHLYLAGSFVVHNSTLIDSMILGLYGSVPRYDDRRLVAPIVHQGAQEGRVRLTFGVGPRRYAATRVVRRTKQGATTKEARLEEVTDGGSVLLAGSADEVTDAVTRLLGLSFEQFTRSVVLPQGAFDRFLFAKPADRADLLIQLLDLGLHEEIGKRARSLAQAETLRAEQADRRLQGELADATPAARDRAAARVDQLTALAQRCERAQGELDQLREEGAALSERAKQADLDLAALDGLRVPDDLDAIRTAAAEVADARAAADQRRAAAEARTEAAETAASQAPDAQQLTELVRWRDEVAQLAADAQALADAVDEARATAAVAADRTAATAAAVEVAREKLDEARRGELVHALTADLHVGDACPVCATPLAEVPTTDGTATTAAQQDLQAAEADHRAAVEAQRRADTAQAAADARVQAQTARQEAATSELTELRTRTGLADDPAVAAAQERRCAVDAELAAAREEERAARRQVQEATTAAEEHARRERTAWRAFDEARDAVARLGPPPTDRDDLAAAWEALRTWAAEARPAAEAAATEAQAAVDAARQRYRQADGDLRTACREADVEVGTGTSPGVAVADALATARSRHEAIGVRVEQVATVTAERDAARRDAQVADQLGKLLRADGFERWLLNRAMRRLVSGASQLLRELTSGGYSLDLDGTNQFLVVDHRNADEPRTVKSLSGGERFLASLALALALAEHVAELAAEGSARLESLFLDEGFGTLDPDTLDVVAAALEELGARGRVVGIVTHVRDLAERLPVRFEVLRGPKGSTVRRVDADAPVAPGTADGDPAPSPAEEVA